MKQLVVEFTNISGLHHLKYSEEFGGPMLNLNSMSLGENVLLGCLVGIFLSYAIPSPRVLQGNPFIMTYEAHVIK